MVKGLSSYNINNHLAKFEKNFSVGSRGCAIIIRRGGGGGGAKNELRNEKYYTIPPLNKGKLALTPPPNFPKIMTQTPQPTPTNIGNIPESFTCFVL